ncbi:MAG: ribonuclease HI [Ardenticatenaceae bacterium]
MSSTDVPTVTIYSDGGCNPNPGPGGWGVVLLFPEQEPQELSGGEPETTNNRMELQAALEGLRALQGPHDVTFYTDSEYLRKGITQWLGGWQKRNWLTAGNTPVKNQDLWQALSAELGDHEIDWQWTKGHAGDKWNERADELASSQIPKPELPLDDEHAIHIFTAASYLRKSKKGGWGVVLRYREHTKTLSGGTSDTSANRMYIQAALAGLQAVKRPMPIHLYTTSDYLKDGATVWHKSWQRRNWQTKEGKPVSHRDLWEELVDLGATYQVNWHVVDRKKRPDDMVQAKELASEMARLDQEE